LNRPNSPRVFAPWLGFRIVAHRAGVSVSATTTDSAIADTSVIANWR
jgi:hypothetical protein